MCTSGVIRDNTTSPIGTFGTEQVGMIPHYPTANAEGIIVSTSIHTGYIPTIKATVKGGRFVNLEGGGEVSKVWMRDWEKCKDCSSEGRLTTFGCRRDRETTGLKS